ncbi:CocE/NonD family hydrolase [Nocardia vulneris]|uniref:CocE/NonD family hydrolase n=1 Tax=Nocardia vulneris TaxID=1141657 RepID=UPI0030D01EA1
MTRRVLWSRRIPAVGGALVADVVLPDDSPGGRWPTLVARTPYGRQSFLRAPWTRLVDRGYALVSCDVRGRGDSDGVFAAWEADTEDGVAVIDWAASQPWSTGDVGTIGGSYDGATQWWAARGHPKALRCMVPMAVGVAGREGERPFMNTGIPREYWMWWFALTAGRTMQDVSAPSWQRHWGHRPLRTLHTKAGFPTAQWPKYVDGLIDFGGPTWRLSDAELAGIDIPVLITVGWWDDHTTLETWQQLQRGPHAQVRQLLVGPWDHAGNVFARDRLGGEDVSAGMLDTLDVVGRFLDRHLKDPADAEPVPRIQLWRTGADTWEQPPAYPAPTVTLPLYLTESNGGAGELVLEQPTTPRATQWTHDARSPVTTLTQLDAFAWSDPPHDQRYLESRSDVITFTSQPVNEPFRISGRAQVRVTVSADALDADLYAWLTDVHPDGRSMLPAGIEFDGLRLSYRNGPERELLEPGVPVTVTLGCPWTHHTFRPGHRIRLNISASLAPTDAPQYGTGAVWSVEPAGPPTTIRLHTGPDTPGALLLPVER